MKTLRRHAALIFVATVLTAPGCRKDNPATCRTSDECGGTQTCHVAIGQCVDRDGGSAADDAPADASDAADAQSGDLRSDAVDGAGEDSTGGCSRDEECLEPGARVCDRSSQSCVQCLENFDCAGRESCDKDAKVCVECLNNSGCSDRSPICESKHCRACKTDAECTTGPKVCLDTGACATDDQTIYVEYNASSCSGSSSGAGAVIDGSPVAPFCKLEDAVAALSSQRPLMVIRGPVNGPLALAPDGFSVIVVGQSSASIRGVDAAIQLASGHAFVRDVHVTSGSALSPAVRVNGQGTKLVLFRVQVTGNAGIGVEANTGAELVMNRCFVNGNAKGGIHNSSAKTTITNTVIADNSLYGVKLESVESSVFVFNTVLGSGLGATCSGGKEVTILGSIIQGGCDACSCSASKEYTGSTKPPVDATYHLGAHLTCDGFVTTVADDMDGDSRAAPYDCGADQYVVR